MNRPPAAERGALRAYTPRIKLGKRPITFRSPVVPLRISGRAEPYSATLGYWRATEVLGDRPERVSGELYYPYRLVLEREPAEDEDPGNVFIEGCYLARALDRAWAYATGRPLTSRGYDLFLAPITPPAEWDSNAADVMPESDWALLQSRLLTASPTREMAQLPLRRSVEILRAINSADDILNQLCTYHYGALVTTDPELHFLLFAQAIEIVRELLPGDSKAEKEGQLPHYVRDRMKRGLNWVFEVCQQRRQTRHAVDKRHGLKLKPDFTDEEEEAFLYEANLLICYSVTNALDFPLAVDDKGVSRDLP